MSKTAAYLRVVFRTVCCLAVAIPACAPPPPAIRIPLRADRVLDVRGVEALTTFLADPALAGRMVGTPGNRLAGQYIAEQLAVAGLRGGAEQGGWFQPIPVPRIRLPGPGCFLRVPVGPPPRMDGDFSPAAAGRPGGFAGRAVFVGYGLRNVVTRRDDYAGVDARGAVVMILQGTAAGTGPKSFWSAKGAKLRRGLLEAKLERAAKQGAVGVLIVSPPAAAGGREVLYSVVGEADGPIPAMRITRALADRVLATAGKGNTIAALAARIAKTKKSAALATNVHVAGRVEFAEGRGRNVIGLLPATTAGQSPAIVIGAHYDHLSFSGNGARDAGPGVRPGADDNASGVAAMILVARALAALERRSRTYVFIAFDGEEYGFAGSRHYVRDPAVPLARTHVMINIDQVGRLRRRKLTVFGSTAAEPFRSALRSAGSPGVELVVRGIPVTSKHRWSDQAAFARAGLATLFFFTGLHGDYHTMGDTTDKLDLAGVTQVARTVFRTALYLDRLAHPVGSKTGG